MTHVIRDLNTHRCWKALGSAACDGSYLAQIDAYKQHQGKPNGHGEGVHGTNDGGFDAEPSA